MCIYMHTHTHTLYPSGHVVNELIFNTTGFPCGSAGQESTCNMGVMVKLLSRVQLFVTPWTVAYHVPLSMGFSRQEYWSGVPLPSAIWETWV